MSSADEDEFVVLPSTAEGAAEPHLPPTSPCLPPTEPKADDASPVSINEPAAAAQPAAPRPEPALGVQHVAVACIAMLALIAGRPDASVPTSSSPSLAQCSVRGTGMGFGCKHASVTSACHTTRFCRCAGALLAQIFI